MSAQTRRILTHSFCVIVTLAAIGYGFALAFLYISRINGGIPDPANQRVLWRTPLTMAILGLIVQLPVELISLAMRRRKPSATGERTEAVPNLPNTETNLPSLPGRETKLYTGMATKVD